MNKSKYLVVLKTPGTSFMVDTCDKGFLKDTKYASFIQEDKMLWIPISIDSNIAYIMEMSAEDVDAFEESVLKARGRILKPKFTIPAKRTN